MFLISISQRTLCERLLGFHHLICCNITVRLIRTHRNCKRQRIHDYRYRILITLSNRRFQRNCALEFLEIRRRNGIIWLLALRNHTVFGSSRPRLCGIPATIYNFVAYTSYSHGYLYCIYLQTRIQRGSAVAIFILRVAPHIHDRHKYDKCTI